MANTYTFVGPGTRWTAETPTDEATLNISRKNIDHLWEALNTVMDTDAADGVLTGALSMRIGEPMKIEVEPGTIWTLGWWQSADTRWWLLGNTADVSSFTRADAEFYIPHKKVVDDEVPTS